MHEAYLISFPIVSVGYVRVRGFTNMLCLIRCWIDGLDIFYYKIGYRPFVEACVDADEKGEALKYIPKLADPRERAEVNSSRSGRKYQAYLGSSYFHSFLLPEGFNAFYLSAIGTIWHWSIYRFNFQSIFSSDRLVWSLMPNSTFILLIIFISLYHLRKLCTGLCPNWHGQRSRGCCISSQRWWIAR